jgi:hypothetical protein
MSLNAVVEWVRHTICALRGHDALLQFERGRMYLKCVSCGYESPGWTIKNRDTRPAPAVVHELPRRRWTPANLAAAGRRFLPHSATTRRVA